MPSIDLLSKAVIIVSLPTFVLLRYIIAAPYGKHSLEAKNGNENGNANAGSSIYFGASINARIGWMIFESPNLLWAAWSYVHRDREIFGLPNALLLSMFCIHYLNRSIFYPLRMSSSSRPVPLAVVASGWSYCVVNGYLQGQSLCRQAKYSDHYTQSPHFVIGVAVFVLGFTINLHSDAILRGLCNQRIGHGTSKKYNIPRGGLFELVSCANYTGEIFEWFGYAIACNNVAAVSFFVFTCSNLIPRSLSHHEWYLQKFDDYPSKRRAVLPFLL